MREERKESTEIVSKETEHFKQVGMVISAMGRRERSSKIRLRNTLGWFDKVTGDQVDSGHTRMTARLAAKTKTETGAEASQ